TLGQLFSDIVAFSLPVSVAVLVAEHGALDRRLRGLLRTERYAAALRSLEAQSAAAERATAAQRLLTAGPERQDTNFDEVRQQHQQARDGLLKVEEQVAGLKIRLEDARRDQGRWLDTQQELAEVRQELVNRRVSLA